MYPALQKEIETYEKRTPESREAHQRAVRRVPLGVASNYRYYPPYPLFVREGHGSSITDVDGNQYIDHNLCYGALMAGHCHPAVMQAVEERLRIGTLFGMPHGMELELAEEICARYPVEMVRFGNSGSEVTMHSLRLARAVTGRSKIIKMEGGYHGGHDAISVSVKPKGDQFGDPENPTPVVSSAGVLKGTTDATLVAPFNNLPAIERLFARHPGEIAAVLLEPIMMNIAFCMPDEGYLQGLLEIAHKHGALLIMDEVKTGAKVAWGGACEYFNVKPDILCLGKSIGGGFSLAAFAASREIMDVIATQKMFHAGTYNTNPVVMAAGLATFRHVLTRDAYSHVDRLNRKLVDGYQRIIGKTGLVAYADGAGANGALLLYPQRIRNYRDWYHVDEDVWTHYWFAMVNRGVLAQPYWWDEQWTVSVQHTDKDIDYHLQVFEEVAPALAAAQQERAAGAPAAVSR
jgi:glutamate-1-semialdehyde 2,1-aminomutase